MKGVKGIIVVRDPRFGGGRRMEEGRIGTRRLVFGRRARGGSEGRFLEFG